MRWIFAITIVFAAFSSSASETKAPVDKVALLDLLRVGKFQVLESRLTKLQQESQAADGRDEWVGVAFHSFTNSDPQVLSRLDEWVRQMPQSYSARMARGYHYWALGWLSRGNAYAHKTSRERFAGMHRMFAKARKDLHAALEINNKLSMAYAILISLANAEGRRQDWLQVARAVMSAAPNSYYVRLKILFSLQPKWGGSLKAMNSFIAQSVEPYSDDPALRRLRGYPDFVQADTFGRQRKYDHALTFYERALEFGPHWYFIYKRGQTLRWLNRPDEALEAFNQAASYRPQTSEILLARAWLHKKAGRLDDALRDFTSAIALDSFNPDYLEYRAQVWRTLKRYDLAIKDLDNALVYGTHNARVWSTRGFIKLYNLHDSVAASRSLERAVQLAPHNTNYRIHYIKALFYREHYRIAQYVRSFLRLWDAKGNVE